jgi:hypothetical protein
MPHDVPERSTEALRRPSEQSDVVGRDPRRVAETPTDWAETRVGNVAPVGECGHEPPCPPTCERDLDTVTDGERSVAHEVVEGVTEVERCALDSDARDAWRCGTSLVLRHRPRHAVPPRDRSAPR